MGNNIAGSQEQLGTFVRKSREQAGLTQAQLAELMSKDLGNNLHKTVIAKIEAGTRSLSFLEAVSLSHHLGVSLRSLSLPVKGRSIPEQWDGIAAELRMLSSKWNSEVTYLGTIREQLHRLEHDIDAAGGLRAETDKQLIEALAHSLFESRQALATMSQDLGSFSNLSPYSEITTDQVEEILGGDHGGS